MYSCRIESLDDPVFEVVESSMHSNHLLIIEI